jgi:hypothetical protein
MWNCVDAVSVKGLRGDGSVAPDCGGKSIRVVAVDVSTLPAVVKRGR